MYLLQYSRVNFLFYLQNLFIIHINSFNSNLIIFDFYEYFYYF